jgi:hypothetical protein
MCNESRQMGPGSQVRFHVKRKVPFERPQPHVPTVLFVVCNIHLDMHAVSLPEKPSARWDRIETLKLSELSETVWWVICSSTSGLIAKKEVCARFFFCNFLLQTVL